MAGFAEAAGAARGTRSLSDGEQPSWWSIRDRGSRRVRRWCRAVAFWLWSSHVLLLLQQLTFGFDGKPALDELPRPRRDARGSGNAHAERGWRDILGNIRAPPPWRVEHRHRGLFWLSRRRERWLAL